MQKIADFSMTNVMNTDPYCINALKKEIDYLVSFDVDRLLAGFRENAGLSCKGAVRYEGWESMLIGGHTIGHYLSALSQAYANPGVDNESRATLYKMVCEIILGLLECQKNSKGKDNFLFGAVIVDKNNVELQFDNVEQNKLDITKEAWVPWYTLHKILAGVLDVYRLTGFESALDVAQRIGDWSYNRALTWDEKTREQVLSVEYGGMNDALYDLYLFSNNEKYAIAAHIFDEVKLYEKVFAGGEDVLNDYHANTTIPKFIGALNRYCTCHNKIIDKKNVDAKCYLEYAESFWDMVVKKHTYITGGNSEWEHFGRDYILDKERTNCNCETCNTYNMLKLSRKLFMITGDIKYADYYENAFYNTILSSQNPETGMTTYFQPMATGYFKVYGQRYDKFWCCIGTGMENFTKLNDSIFFQTKDNIIINMFTSATLNSEELGCEIVLEADLKKSDMVTIKIKKTCEEYQKRGLTFRIPDWASDTPIVTVNGVIKEYEIREKYAYLSEDILNLEEISILIPKKVVAYQLPDDDRCVAFKYGPFVLSANLGCEKMQTSSTGVIVTIPAEKIEGWDNIILPGGITKEELLEYPEKYMIRDEKSDELKFYLSINGLEFGAHYLRYKQRYGIYFRIDS